MSKISHKSYINHQNHAIQNWSECRARNVEKTPKRTRIITKSKHIFFYPIFTCKKAQNIKKIVKTYGKNLGIFSKILACTGSISKYYGANSNKIENKPRTGPKPTLNGRYPYISGSGPILKPQRRQINPDITKPRSNGSYYARHGPV